MSGLTTTPRLAHVGCTDCDDFVGDFSAPASSTGFDFVAARLCAPAATFGRAVVARRWGEGRKTRTILGTDVLAADALAIDTQHRVSARKTGQTLRLWPHEG